MQKLPKNPLKSIYIVKNNSMINQNLSQQHKTGQFKDIYLCNIFTLLTDKCKIKHTYCYLNT